MKVEYKYKVGSKVFFVKMISIPFNKPCDICEGTGKLKTFSDKEVSCVKCNGTGTCGDGGSIKEIVQDDVVERVNIYIEHDETEVTYILAENGDLRDEYWLYKTFEEADATINKNSCIGYTS